MAQDFLSIIFWQVEVEQDESGDRRLLVGVGGVEKMHRLLPVIKDVNGCADIGPGNGFPNQKHVRLVVLDDEDQGP